MNYLIYNGFWNSTVPKTIRMLEAASVESDMPLQVCKHTEWTAQFDPEITVFGPNGAASGEDTVLFWDKDVRLARALQHIGVKVENLPDAIALCDDKSATHLALSAAAVPMPRTLVAPMAYTEVTQEVKTFLERAKQQLGFPMVVKECFGSLGGQVYLAENGKVPEGKKGVPSYRTDEVLKRVEQLKQARDALGEAGKDLALDDMKVIQQDYKNRKIDPMKNGIVDVENLTPEQMKEYTERMEVLEFLRDARGKDFYPNTSRYHGQVDITVSGLRKARADYEKFVDGAEKDLPITHPKVVAVQLYNLSSYDNKFSQKVSFDDVAKLAQNIQGKNFDAAQLAAKQQIREIQIRDQHAHIDPEPYQRQGSM